MPARWGQNFLADPAWRRRVALALAPEPQHQILEIGGGNGELSALLAGSGCGLTIVEMDPELASALTARFAGVQRVRVIAADILSLDWAALAPAPAAWRLFGNLPYYISGPILGRFFRNVDRFTDATFMVQREIAARLTAAPGPNYGRLSAAAQFFCRPRQFFEVPPGAFRPRPKVWSSLVALPVAGGPALAPAERDRFLNFLRLAFSQKRKRLANNLKPGYPAARIAAAMAETGLAPPARAEECPAATLWRLFRALVAAPAAGAGAPGP